MKRTTLCAALLAAGIGVGGMAAPEPADAGGFSIYIAPKTEKGKQRVERGLKAFSRFQERRAAWRARRGGENSASITQNGSGNTAGVFQRGSGHDAAITQNGDNNAFGVFQFGRGASADVHQNGDGEAGLLFQGGW